MSDDDFVLRAPSYEDAYQKLRMSFLERLQNSLAAIDNVLAQKQIAPLKKEELERAMHLAHGLAGSGTTFGFPDVSAKGQKIDAWLDRIIKAAQPDYAMENEDFDVLEVMMLDLRSACTVALDSEDIKPLVKPKDGNQEESIGMKNEYSVLLVDDDRHLLDFLTLKLRQKKIRVIGVPDGETAMRQIARDVPDLIVLDIMMPGLNGHEILRRLKQDPQYVSIPVLMLTGQAQEKDVVSALHSGAIDYVVKPVDPDQLVGRIEKILDASRYNVVIADNDPLILQLLDSKFRHRGFKVRMVEDGRKAWEMIFRTLPDLVILDRMMPGLEGLSILQNMRDEEATKHIPVIILSARKQDRDVDDGLKRGAQDYIGKPFIPDDVINRSLKLLNLPLK